MLSVKSSGQWLVSCFYHDAIPHPLPELGLRGPELSPVAADNEGRLALLLFLLVFVFFDDHILLNTRVALHGISYRHRAKTPRSERSHT